MEGLKMEEDILKVLFPLSYGNEQGQFKKGISCIKKSI
jgi:hypothetical protein